MHLGLASLVFPGAEHSRFAHSIGVMHVMTQMIDRLKEEGCEYFIDDFNRRKQKLRLAALMHDIGHYPLAHLGEQTFKWIDETQNIKSIYETSGADEKESENLLIEAAKEHKSDAASHEQLGKLILSGDGSEIKKILDEYGYDPAEIARIFNAEEKSNPFYTQLMSSTLDCDRLDYMLRDSLATGTDYGHIDLRYILQNIRWDSDKQLICYDSKAITAIEHFIASRYFSYNVIYHKTIMGFELMAKALFYSMINDKKFNDGDYEGIIHSFDDIKKKMLVILAS
jgi:HD superfamily phosphohydrolase